MERNTGSDFTIEFTITTEDGTPIPISALEGLAIFLVYENEKVLKRYTLNEVGGHDPVNIVDGPAGKVDINIPRELTETSEKGHISAEIKVGTTNADFTDGVQHHVIKKENIFYLDGATIRKQALA